VTSRLPLVSPQEPLRYGDWDIPPGVSSIVLGILKEEFLKLIHCKPPDTDQHDSPRRPSRSIHLHQPTRVFTGAMALIKVLGSRTHESSLRALRPWQPNVCWSEVSASLLLRAVLAPDCFLSMLTCFSGHGSFALAEIYIVIACLFRRFDLQLHDTIRERDIDVVRDCFIGEVSPESAGVRIKSLGVTAIRSGET